MTYLVIWRRDETLIHRFPAINESILMILRRIWRKGERNCHQVTMDSSQQVMVSVRSLVKDVINFGNRSFKINKCIIIILHISYIPTRTKIAQSVCQLAVYWILGSRDPGPNPACRRWRQLVSFRFENRLPVPEHRIQQQQTYISFVPCLIYNI